MAVGIWAILAGSGMVMILGSLRVNRLADESDIATHYAAEGIDAVDALRKQGWSSPLLATNCLSGCGLATAAGTWAFVGTSNTFGRFTRQILVAPVNRDGAGNIVSSGGTVDSDTYKVESRVSWNRGVPPITNTISLTSYLTNYAKMIATLVVGGLTVYGDGTVTPKMRTYDKTNNTFSATNDMVTGASGVTFQVRTSPTRAEAVSGYVTATGLLQIMCFDGTTWTNDWSVPIGGNGTTKRFDIAYETGSGDVMVLYSSNTAGTDELAYRTKSGTMGCGSGSWTAVANLDPVGTTGTVQWVKMAWDRASSSNLITAIWADSNSDLSAMVWSGATWGNEPVTALETNLQVITVAQDTEDFDVEYETSSGDVIVVWGTAVESNVNGVRYSTCNGRTASCTWSGVLTPPTFVDDATNMDISAHPNTDEMVFASIGINQNDLQIGYWNGSAWTSTANADTSCNNPIAGSGLVTTGWLVSGAVSQSVVMYVDQGSSAIDWYTGTTGIFSKQIDFVQLPAPNGPTYYKVEMDPVATDQLTSMVSDGANDLFAKRLVLSAGPAFTWTNSDGAALATALPQAINSPYSFAYWRQ